MINIGIFYHFLGGLTLVMNSSSCFLILSSMWNANFSISSLMMRSILPGPLSIYSFYFSICCNSVSEKNCFMSSISLTGITFPYSSF